MYQGPVGIGAGEAWVEVGRRARELESKRVKVKKERRSFLGEEIIEVDYTLGD